MDPLAIALFGLGAWAIGELAAAAGARLLYRWTRIYWSPRTAPRLSEEARAFTRRLIEHDGRGELKAFSSTLGWTHAPGAISNDGSCRINQVGARADREFQVEPAAGKLRVATFGDCLIFGGGVQLEETWQGQLEALDPRLELLNFGVEGYGPDQMLLRYREIQQRCRSQRVVVLGLAATNIFKSLNAYRPFYAYDYGLQLAKPRFKLTPLGLELLPNPIPDLAGYEKLLKNPNAELRRLGQGDEYFQRSYCAGALSFLPSVRLCQMVWSEFVKRREVRNRHGQFRPNTEALQTTLGILSQFHDEAKEHGALPVVLLMPVRGDLLRFRRRGMRPWEALCKQLDLLGCRWLDPLDVLGGEEAPEVDALFVGRHYSPTAHGLIARQVFHALNRWLPP